MDAAELSPSLQAKDTIWKFTACFLDAAEATLAISNDKRHC